VGVAASALTVWLQAARITSGPIFRRVRGSVVAEALEPQAVRAIVKRRAALARLKGNYSAHSLRSGFMTEAGRQNVPLTAVRNFQAGAVEKSQAGNLLGNGGPKEG
jgi:predicted RNA polymerase sigma factor